MAGGCYGAQHQSPGDTLRDIPGNGRSREPEGQVDVAHNPPVYSRLRSPACMRPKALTVRGSGGSARAITPF